MDDRLGLQLGHYRLNHLLGQGGFAQVYLGEHIHLGTSAAIKVLRTRLTDRDSELFLNEARTIARLDHPHIVRILDFGIEDNIPFIVMEYAPHGSLATVHPEGTVVPINSIILYINQLAGALQHAHDHKLIHRDVKPQNMLMKQNGDILLSDFGLALVAQSSSILSIQEMAGTPIYMAPEQLQGKPTFASDQYALGIVTYKWLCGKYPFHGRFDQLLMQHIMASPPSLREIAPYIPAAVEQVVLKSLAKKPEERFASVRDFARALEGAVSQAPYEIQPLASLPPSQQDSESLLAAQADSIQEELIHLHSANEPDFYNAVTIRTYTNKMLMMQLVLRKAIKPLAHIFVRVVTPFVGLVRHISNKFQSSAKATDTVSLLLPVPEELKKSQKGQNYPLVESVKDWTACAPFIFKHQVTSRTANVEKPEQRKNILILHSKRDRSWADWIASTLEKEHYSTILPDWDFRPGYHFDNELRRAKEIAERTILVLSPDFLNERSIQSRWSTMFGRNVMNEEGMLIPVLVRDCGQDLRKPLELLVSIDLTERDLVTAREKLLAGVRSASSRPPIEPLFPPHMKAVIDTERPDGHDKTAMVTRQISLGPALIEHIVSQVDSAMTKKGMLAGDLEHALILRMKPGIESAFQKKDWIDVIRKADLLIQQAPESVPWDVYRMKGLALREEGLWSQAHLALETALALVTDQQQRLILLNECTVVLTMLNQWDGVLRYADEALRLTPNDLNWLTLRLHTRAQLERVQNMPDTSDVTKKQTVSDPYATVQIPGDVIMEPRTKDDMGQLDASEQLTVPVRDSIPQQVKPVEIFFAYSREDEILRNKIEVQLSVLKRLGLIVGWHDREVAAGKEWESEIDKHLNTAHIILLLISADFLSSEYCYGKEMKRALERHAAKETRVIPIILRPTSWKSTQFGKLQVLPKDGRPVTSWERLDEALFSIEQGIYKAVEELIT
jgi:serine/threonine protein kinase